MKEFVLILLVAALVLYVVHSAYRFTTDDRVEIFAPDGRRYMVRNTKNKDETAAALARVNDKVIAYISRLYNEADEDKKAMATRIKMRYNPDALSESKIDKNYTSFTVNKGEHISLCLRTRDTKDEIYDDNLIFYVTLHELGHIASVTEDHSPEFYENFRYLLKKASEWNMWTRVTKPFDYCGINVKSM